MASASHTKIQVGAGRYELIRKLGSGNFGEVHLATDLDEGGEVAVKLFKPHVRLDDAVLEAQLQRRLSEHPRVVALRNLDIRTSAGPIVVTAFMPGGSVGDRIGAGAAGLVLGLRWTVDVADALVHAHAQGVLHRDAKPSNLLLDATEHACLCDFGVAEDCFTSAGGSAVYPALAAPERLHTGTTEQTEVWMLGTLLYRLVLGSYPYPTGATGVPAGTQINPQILVPQIPTALARVMQRALAIDPADRYASARELRDALLAVKVVTEFAPTSIADGAVARWTAPVSAGTAIVEVVKTPNSTFSARLRLDRGGSSGPRTVRSSPRRDGQAGALRDGRTLLRAVVEGRMP